MNLVKGEAMDLTKDNPGVKKFAFAAGWDLSQGAEAFDLDIFAVPTAAGGKFTGDHNKDVVFFNNLSAHGIKLDKDNRTGEGDGDDETMVLDLSAVPTGFDEIWCVINIYQGDEKGQRFGQVENSYARIYDAEKGPTSTEIAKYELRGDFKKFTAVVMGKFYRKGSEWEFEAVGKGTTGSILDVTNAIPNI